MRGGSERNHRFSGAVPSQGSANQGAASTSTKLSASSLRQTKELHSGRLPARIRPSSTHLAPVVTPAATSPPPSSTTPPTSGSPIHSSTPPPTTPTPPDA